VKTISGRVYTTTQVSYEENSFSIVYPIGTGEQRLMVWDDTVSYSSSFVSQSVAQKLKTWDEEKSGDTDFYPSINAMEEYVTLAMVQSDWNQNDTSALDFIKNKPDIVLRSEIEEELTSEDILNLFIELNLINPLTDEKGFILTENDNTLLVF
jgi:hypothetical protein